MRALSVSDEPKGRSQSQNPPKLKPSTRLKTPLKAEASAEGETSALLSVGKVADRKELPSKFGISISKKVSKRAVVRNRIKRQIKAIIYQHLPYVTPGWRVVIVVRPAAVQCEFADFLRELEYLLKKLRITDTHLQRSR